MVFFHFNSNFDQAFCKQTVKTLVLHHIIWHLIWVCTVLPMCQNRTPGLYWLDTLHMLFQNFNILFNLSRFCLDKKQVNYLLKYMQVNYSKTCVKWPRSKRPKIGFQDECRSKVLQNASRGAFCNTFNLH